MGAYQILGIDISDYSREEFFKRVEQRLQDAPSDSSADFVVTVNPEIVIESIIDNDFKQILHSSNMNTADGVGIQWAVNQLYGEEVERITGSDSVEKICTISAQYGRSVFLYGAMANVAEQAAEQLRERIPDLQVSGTYSPDDPAIPFEKLPEETQREMKEASVVFVALGAPKQEKWIHNNMDKLPNCKLIIGIGGSFDFLAGTVKRAPKWMCKSGLEWVFRLFAQPSRWRRMLKLPLFAMNVLLLKTSSNHGQHHPDPESLAEG